MITAVGGVTDPTQLAAADTRRQELGERIAEGTPQWAREALGPVPDDVDRVEWEHRAGWVGAYRELADHTDQAAPSAPPAGLAEKHAAWRAAHDALHLPDAGPDEAHATAHCVSTSGTMNAKPNGHTYAAEELAERRAKSAATPRGSACLGSVKAHDAWVTQRHPSDDN